jgi:chorismate mutase/prephenate dehydratase
MEDKKAQLEALRVQIDDIDDRVLELLNQRASLVLEVGRVKEREQGRFHVLEREEAIYRRLVSQNEGPFPSAAIRPIFREIISASLSLEKKLNIAYLGPEATFSHIAAMQQFGSSVDFAETRSVPEIFDEVERERADYGVVPIENSTEGVVNLTLDMFIESPLQICAEVVMQISQSLLSMEQNLSAIKVVYSHPQALAQCYGWLRSNLPQAEFKETFSTAMAAKTACEKPHSAAIASEFAGRRYNLPVCRRNIEDNAYNYTRFWVIGHVSPGKTGNDKTSLMFSIKDGVGALHDMLLPFANHDINLRKIESRPFRNKPWEYIFFLDIDGHTEDKNVQQALEAVSQSAQFIKVLGAYPARSHDV